MGRDGVGTTGQTQSTSPDLLCDGIAPMGFKGDLQLFQFAKLSEELEGFNEETVARSLSGKQVPRNSWTARLGVLNKSHGELESYNVIKD